MHCHVCQLPRIFVFYHRQHSKGWRAGCLEIRKWMDGSYRHMHQGADKFGRFTTIEGNTNAAGEREGMFVMRKDRRTGLPFKEKGLNLIGFIYPPNV